MSASFKNKLKRWKRKDCPVCGKEFPTKRQSLQHFTLVHKQKSTESSIATLIINNKLDKAMRGHGEDWLNEMEGNS